VPVSFSRVGKTLHGPKLGASRGGLQSRAKQFESSVKFLVLQGGGNLAVLVGGLGKGTAEESDRDKNENNFPERPKCAHG
jgi:hypothetical protein